MGFFKSLFGSSSKVDDSESRGYDDIKYDTEEDTDDIYDDEVDDEIEDDSTDASDRIQNVEVKIPLTDGVEDFIEQEEDAICYENPSTYFSVIENEGTLFACNLADNTVYFEFYSDVIKQLIGEGNVVAGRVVQKVSDDGRYAKVLLQIISDEKSEEDTAITEEVDASDNVESNGDIREHYLMWYWMDEEMDSRRKTMMDGRITFNVAGLRYRDNCFDLLESLEIGEILTLRPEPDNQYDPNALGFYRKDDTLVGYLPKKDQPFAHLFFANTEIKCTISEINGDYVDTEFIPTKEMVVPSVIEDVNMHLEKVLVSKDHRGVTRQHQTLTLDEFIKAFK